MKRKIACFDLYKLFCIVLFISISTHSWGQKAANVYIEKHKKVAVILKNQSGIPASIILGVSMIESAMGKSRNCQLLNNYFGIKGKNNLPKTKGAPRSSYKQYPNSSASFKDFVRIVKNKKYYPELKGDMDYKKWLVKMNQYGYAQAKGKWIIDITSVIKKYDLDTFDRDTLIFDDDTYPIWGADTTLILLQEQD